MEGLYIFGLVSVKSFQRQHGNSRSGTFPLTSSHFPVLGELARWADDIPRSIVSRMICVRYHEFRQRCLVYPVSMGCEMLWDFFFKIHGYQYAIRYTRTCLVCAFVIFCDLFWKSYIYNYIYIYILHGSFLEESWMESEVTASQPSSWVQLVLSYIHVQ